MCLTKPGQPRQWKQLRRQNWNNRYQHFQIQPIKCPVQNNEISNCLLASASDVYATTPSVKCQAQTGSTFMCLQLLRNNYMLHSVYFRSLVDLENKSCVRVPLVITLPECELNQLSRWSKKALQIVCEQLCFTCVQIEMYELGNPGWKDPKGSENKLLAGNWKAHYIQNDF